jgi:hypothetical protein
LWNLTEPIADSDEELSIRAEGLQVLAALPQDDPVRAMRILSFAGYIISSYLVPLTSEDPVGGILTKLRLAIDNTTSG